MKKNKLIFISIILCWLGLLTWSSIIYVPEIKGRVIDAETGKPMQGVNMRIRWVTGYADPGGGHGGTFKVYATKTDTNGQFVLPRTIKPKIPIIETYRGEQIVIYEHGYVHQDIWRDAQRNEMITNHEVALTKINSDEEYHKNITKLAIGLLSSDTIVFYDLSFLADEYKIFLSKYADSGYSDQNYRNLASLYEIDMHDYRAALEINREFAMKYPRSSAVDKVKSEDIPRLEKLLNNANKGTRHAQ